MTISPEAFMAQPTELDEDIVDPIPQLVTGSAGDITLTSVEQMVDILPGPLHYIAEYLRQIADHFNGTGAAAEALSNERSAYDGLREAFDDREAQYATLYALLEEIETIIKPSTSKLANSVRDTIKAWRDPEVPKIEGGHGEGFGTGLPNDVDYTDTEVRVAEFLAGDAAAHPAHDAGIGIWREYAVREGLLRDAVEGMNRSQIRTALGIPQPEAGA